MNPALIRNMLVDVQHLGSAQVHRKKLAFFLGRTNITGTAWTAVIDEWEDMGNARNSLQYVEHGDTFTFLVKQSLQAEA